MAYGSKFSRTSRGTARPDSALSVKAREHHRGVKRSQIPGRPRTGWGPAPGSAARPRLASRVAEELLPGSRTLLYTPTFFSAGPYGLELDFDMALLWLTATCSSWAACPVRQQLALSTARGMVCRNNKVGRLSQVWQRWLTLALPAQSTAARKSENVRLTLSWCSRLPRNTALLEHMTCNTSSVSVGLAWPCTLLNRWKCSFQCEQQSPEVTCTL